jgi:hypothetical protein
MIRVSFHALATGEITRRAMLAPELVALNLAPGEGVVAGWVDGTRARVVAGQIVPKPEAEIEAEALARAWADLRMARNARLSASDWTQVPDAPVDRAAWARHRQALRDLPASTADPRAPLWPDPP